MTNELENNFGSLHLGFSAQFSRRDGLFDLISFKIFI